MNAWLALSINLVLPVVMTSIASSHEIWREPLDRLWEEHMLAGTSAIYSDGTRVNYVPEWSFESAKGSASAAWLTKEGIAVSDLRETRFLGLWSRGGWSLHGGLLARISEGPLAIELYGKTVLRSEPVSLFLGLLFPHVDYTREYSDEFFLLLRKRGTPGATVVRKWVFGEDELPIPEGLSLSIPGVRGYLKHDPASKAAAVTITGLKRPFEEQVDVFNIFGR